MSKWRLADYILLPFLAIVLLICTLDGSNLDTARDAGLDRDLKLSTTDFDLASSLFSASRTLFKAPVSMAFLKTRAHFRFSAMLILWGLVTICSMRIYSI